MAPLERDLPGYWGKATATIDWCEANYEVTTYIAEFWNTISNVFMVVPPLIGMVYAIKDGFESRFIWCHFTLLMVGIGSTCFHGTLLYEMQLLDELPMIYGACFMIYSLIEVDGAPKSHNRRLQVGLTLYCTIVTVVYLTVKNPIFHEAAYGALVVGMIGASIRIVRKVDHSFPLFIIGLGSYAVGFVIWNSDYIFCRQLKGWRSQVRPQLRPLLQGHAWWHILAGVGTYLGLIFNMHARQKYLKRQPRVQISPWVWPFLRGGPPV